MVAAVGLVERRLALYRKALRLDGEVVQISHKKDFEQRRQITIQADMSRQVQDSDRTWQTLERLEVFCLSNPDDADFGGIAQPVEGLLLFRQQGPRQTVPFEFNGEILSSDEGHFVLVFHRHRLVSQAGGRIG
jgi:hypothetical protein